MEDFSLLLPEKERENFSFCLTSFHFYLDYVISTQIHSTKTDDSVRHEIFKEIILYVAVDLLK